MAFNALKQSRSAMIVSARSLASSTPPRFASSATTRTVHQQQQAGGKLKSMAASLGPMWVVIGIMGGMVGAALCIGAHTAKQQLFHSPQVQVTKKNRGSIPEVDNPDAVMKSAGKFENKSFLRKVAHIQDNVPNREHPHQRDVETLKTMGTSK